MIHVGPDGKLRIRCPECGKRLKLPPGKPGKIYRCPICAATVISPLDQGGGTLDDQDRHADAALRELGWSPTIAQKERYKSLENFANFIGRTYLDLAQSCGDVLASKPYGDVEAGEKILALRREKENKLREFVQRLLSDLDMDIAELERHPMRKNPIFVEKLEQKRREKRDLLLFMKHVFNITMPADSGLEPPTPNPQPPSS